MNPDYHSYSSREFASDDYFQRWVFRPDPETEQFWQAFMRQHPGQVPAMTEARSLLTRLGEDADAPPAGRKQAVWERIQAQLREEARPVRQPARTMPLWQKWAAGVAAMFLLVTAYLYFIYAPAPGVYTTRSGEKRVIQLPDSSEVVLNEESTLRLAEAWNRGESREVWLEGEAYFEVRKKPGAGNARFIVHTSNLNVEVLGTRFNVNTRRERTQVVLSEGQVKINPLNQSADSALYLAPGEAVTVGAQQPAARQTVKPEFYTAWTSNELVLNKTTLREISTFIEENYQLSVRFQHDSLPDLILDGTALPTGDRDIFLKAVTTALDIQAEVRGRELIFKP
jgi:transmembrane sensor